MAVIIAYRVRTVTRLWPTLWLVDLIQVEHRVTQHDLVAFRHVLWNFNSIHIHDLSASVESGHTQSSFIGHFNSVLITCFMFSGISFGMEEHVCRLKQLVQMNGGLWMARYSGCGQRLEVAIRLWTWKSQTQGLDQYPPNNGLLVEMNVCNKYVFEKMWTTYPSYFCD